MVATVHVGIDGSGPSRTALAWAVQYAADFGVPLVIEHVVADSETSPDSDARREQLARGEQLVQSARAEIVAEFDGLEVSAHVLVGELASALVAECGTGDLLVIGTHKTGFLRGRVFGARGLEVVARSSSAVAVIPADHRSSRTGVVIAVTASGSSAAVESGVEFAARRHEPIVLVASATASAAAEVGPVPSVVGEAVQLVGERAPRASVRSQVTRRPLADAVLDVSRAAQLLVLPEERGDGAHFVSPFTHDVLLNINCPVLVVPATGTFAPVPE